MIIKKKTCIFLIILSGLLVTSIYGYVRWQTFKQTNQLTIDWQGLGINHHGITLKTLTIQKNIPSGHRLIIKAQAATLSWSTLSFHKLTLYWQPTTPASTPEVQNTTFNPLDILNALQWLPNTIHIHALTTRLPCTKGQCQLTGYASIFQNKQPNLPVSIESDLTYNQQTFHITGDLYKKHHQIDIRLSTDFNKQPLLYLSTQLELTTFKHWQGQFQIFDIKDHLSLFKCLQDWLPSNQPITSIPESIRTAIEWQFNSTQNLNKLQVDQGYFAINAYLPKPWPIPNLGYLQGNINTKISINHQQLNINNLQTDIKLTELAPSLKAKLPPLFQPNTLTFQLQSQNNVDNKTFQLNASTEGTINSQLTGLLNIDKEKKQLTLTNALLKAHANEIKTTQYQLKKFALHFPLTATLAHKQLIITTDDSTFISLQQFKNSFLTLNTTKLTTPTLNIQLDYQKTPSLTVNSPFTLTTTGLKNTYLNPLNWQLAGQLTADSSTFNLIGKLSNSAKLIANLNLHATAQSLTATLKLPKLILSPDNSLRRTIKHWPDTLDITKGKIHASGYLNLPFHNLTPTINASLALDNLTGIFDRTEFKSLTVTPSISITHQKLHVNLPLLSIQEINPGIIMGPLTLSASYKTPLHQLTTGTLSWSKASLDLFKGQLNLPAKHLNLSKLPQSFTAKVNHLQLQELLNAYPTEGLTGTGTIIGTLPITVNTEGLTIENGQLETNTGGRIEFNSKQINELGKNNPNMKLVTDAIRNFHYTNLSSQVSYQQGNAILGLHIKGKNPSLDNSQPINLNLTLQENIPALLTSLQLSDRVDETIQKRVQKRLQQAHSQTP